MGCCNGRSWKREEKLDHKFDYLEIKDFHTNAFGCRLAHFFVWTSAFRAFAILGLDIYTAIALLILKSYQAAVQQQTFIAHDITKWIFCGCIILSVVLLFWDWFVAIRIMRSKNISFAFTNVIANRVYSMRDYDYHCLFYRLSSSDHRSNKIIFWVFFSFQGWKRLIFSEGPRQVINALTVFSVLSTRNFSFEPADYASITLYQWTVIGFMGLSLLIWLFSFVRFCLAALLFLPILCHLQGGLTEFVVRKIDKRIEQIIEKARKKRLHRYAQARNEAARHPGEKSKKPGLQRSKSIVAEKPTLPNISMGKQEQELYASRAPSYAFTGDNASIYSQDSMHKSASSYSLGAYPLARSETLPLYRSQTQDSLHSIASSSSQMIPTLPTLPSPDSNNPSMRLNNRPGEHRGIPGGPRRPQMPSVPSYHRQESYSRPPVQREPSHGNIPRRDPSSSVRPAHNTSMPRNLTPQNDSGYSERHISPNASHQSLRSNPSAHSSRSTDSTSRRYQ